MDVDKNHDSEEFKFLNELGRKSIHITVWAIPLAYHLVMPGLGISLNDALLIIRLALLGFFCLFIPLEIYRIKFNPNTWINHFTRASEKDGPANYILTATVWLVLLLGVNVFYEMEVAELVLITTVMGDSAAALIGKGIGRNKLPLTDRKTIEGFLAGLITNYAFGFGFLLVVWDLCLPTIILPIIPTIVWGLFDFLEDLPWYLADNLFTPPIAAIIIALLELIAA
jgi:dolichol kinase